MGQEPFHTSFTRRTRMGVWTCGVLVCALLTCGGVLGSGYELGGHPRFICTPIPPDAPCPSSDSTAHHRYEDHQGERYGEHRSRHHSARYTGHHADSLWGESGDATPAILHLRESLVQQKETILDQRETIRELTSKLALCQGFGHGLGGPEHGYEHGHAQYRHHHGNGEHTGDEMMNLSHSSSPEQMSHMLETLKERLESLQTQNTSTTYSASLKELLRRKISALEQRLLHHMESVDDANHQHHQHHHGDDKDDDVDHHDGQRDANDNHHAPGRQRAAQDRRRTRDQLDKALSHLTHGSRTRGKSSRSFQIGFPIRTNYMYGRVKRTVSREIYAMTLCMWLKGGASGIGTPFSYSTPGQANELVLIEWGNKPMELLIKDTAVILPVSLHDGKWHHMCVTWSARDGVWEVYQDGVKRGSGDNLNAWQPIKPGGVFILGQEQDILGGRFDATQAFVGEISDLQLWSHTLTHHDIYSLASCRGHMSGDVINWAESVVELHGGVTKYPFDPCH